MKRLTTVLVLTALAFAAASARAAERLFVAVDYMHIPETSSEADYLAVEKLWQRVHQKAADSGLCRGWYLDRVENGGRNQFVTVRVYDSVEKLVDPWPESLTKGLFNSEEQAKMARTGAVRNLTRSELWEIEASTLKSVEGDPHAYTTVNFMKVAPGKGEAYYNLEKNIYAKVHKARVDAGQMNGWLFLSRVYPSGHDAEFDFITADIYPDKAASEKSYDMKVVESALSKDELSKAMQPDQLRSIVRQEVWHPIAHAVPHK
jgi:hypothetical protein